MSDYELIMIILEVMTVVIAFGTLVALICLGKDKQPFVTNNWITERPFHHVFYPFEMSPTVLLVWLSIYIIESILYIVKYG